MTPEDQVPTQARWTATTGWVQCYCGMSVSGSRAIVAEAQRQHSANHRRRERLGTR